MTTISRLDVVIGGDLSGLNGALTQASSTLKRAGKQMQRAGRQLSVGVTAPLVGIGVAAVKSFADFDNAMNQSVAIMGDVSDAMRGEMSEAAKEVARTTTTSATQAAESFFFLASAGLDAEQSIAALPQVAAFAQAGMFDMSQATDLLTDAQSALGLAADDVQQNLENMARVSDVLVKANTLANASVEQFSTALTTEAGAALKSFGIDVEEGVAVLAAFADQGIKGEKAGSGLSRVLRLMSQAANSNKEELKALGLEIFDAEGNMRNLGDIVANLETSLAGMSDEQRTAALESIGFSARVQGMILPLLGTSEAIKEYEAGLRDAGGTTAQVADNQLKSFSAQMTIVKNNVMVAAASIGEQLAPVVARIGEFVTALSDRISNLNPTIVRWGIAIAAVAAAIGPVLIAVGSLTAAAGAAAPVLAALTGPIGLVVAGVALAAAAFFKWREEITGFISGALEPLKPIINSVVGVAKSFGALVLEIATTNLKVLGNILGTGIVLAFKAMGAAARVVIELLNATLVPALGGVRAALDFMREGFAAARDFVATAMQRIAEFVLGMVDRALGAFERLTSFIPVLGEKVSAAREGFQNWATDALSVRDAMAAVQDVNESVAPAVERTTKAVRDQTEAVRENADAVTEAAAAAVKAAQFEEVALLDLENTIQGLTLAHEELEDAAVGTSSNIEIQAGGAFQRMADAVAANANQVLGAVERVLRKLSGGGGFLGGLTSIAGGFLSGGPLGALGAFGGLFADGGRIQSGEFGIVGERGPEIVTGPAQVTPMVGDMTLRIDPSSIPPPPPTLSPEAAAISVWYRQLFSEMVLDGKARGVLS